jgi:hypothetical protein
LVSCCYKDQNAWNTIPVSEQKNTLNYRTLNSQTKRIEQQKSRMNNRQTLKLATNKTNTDSLNIKRKIKL